MNEEVVKIKYKLSYRLEMTALSIVLGAVYVFVLLATPDERLYCISDNILSLVLGMVGLCVALPAFHMTVCSFYDCVIIDGKNITIRSFLHKTVSGDSYLIRKYRITKEKKKELSNEDTIDITCDESEISLSTNQLTDNYTVLVDYLKKYCIGPKRVNNSKTGSKKKKDVEPEDDYIEKWNLKVPNIALRRYVTISRLLLEIGLLSYVFAIQFVIDHPVNVLCYIVVIVYSWLIMRFVFWQDAFFGYWLDPKFEEMKSKNHKWQKAKSFLSLFIVTPILGMICFYMRASNAFERYHIYELGNMDKAILLYSVGIWFVAILLKNLCYGKNTLSIKVNLIRQILTLFVIVLLSGHVIYGISLLYKPECHIQQAEVIDKRAISHHKGGTSYYIDVVYGDGIKDTFRVWTSTYDSLDSGGDADIAVYNTVFGSEYKHLVEPEE